MCGSVFIVELHAQISPFEKSLKLGFMVSGCLVPNQVQKDGYVDMHCHCFEHFRAQFF